MNLGMPKISRLYTLKLAERDCMVISVKSPRIISNGFRESMDKASALTELVGIGDLFFVEQTSLSSIIVTIESTPDIRVMQVD